MGSKFRSTLLALLAAVALSVMFASTAGAEPGDAYVGGKVESKTTLVVTPPKTITEVKSAGNESLAVTGSDATELALIGVAAIAVGGSILMIRRRTAH